MSANKLTDKECAAAKCPMDKRRATLSDGGGLYLFVERGGGKSWYLRRTQNGKRSEVKLGDYPAMPLKAAREACAKAKGHLQQGLNPREERQRERLQQTWTFAQAAAEWEQVQASVHEGARATQAHRERLHRILERYLLPTLGAQPLARIQSPDILRLMQSIGEDLQARGYRGRTRDDAYRIVCGVFQQAKATGRAKDNPAEGIKGFLNRTQPLPPEKHHASIIDTGGADGSEAIKKLGQLALNIQNACNWHNRTPVVQALLYLSLLLFQRPGNMRKMRWEHIDFESATWRIPSVEMKRRRAEKLSGKPHIVPLPRQVLTTLHNLWRITPDRDKASGWVFTGRFNPQAPLNEQLPLSNNAVNKALRDMGYSTQEEQTGHGFRAIARSIIVERLGVPSEVVERQLAHQTRENLGEAYDRAEFLPQRRDMMQAWADYLDELTLQAADSLVADEVGTAALQRDAAQRKADALALQVRKAEEAVAAAMQMLEQARVAAAEAAASAPTKAA